MVLGFDKQRPARVLLIAPLFGEANKFRRQISEIASLLDIAGADVFCPDLPGCNESLEPHREQTLASWRIAAAAAASHFNATHILALRAGSWLAPDTLPGWLFAPPRPDQVLRSLVRAYGIALREAGAKFDPDAVLEAARREGVTIGGWVLGAELVRELESSTFEPSHLQETIEQDRLGGPGLWLSSENQFDAGQAQALTAIVASGLRLS